MRAYLLNIILLLLFGSLSVSAQETVNYAGEVRANAGSGTFAPLYMSALEQGTLSASRRLTVGLHLWHEMDTASRLSWAYGVKAYAGPSSSMDYERYDANAGWTVNKRRDAAVWLQELYGTLKWRSLFLEVGMRNQHSPLLNEQLTSGDLIQSGNSRPLPGVRAGFIDFQDIPFTKGWVQIEGQLFYGRYTDSDWWADRYNYYMGHISHDQWMVYRRCYFRTKPSARLSVTVGVQCATQFGGTTDYYTRGVLSSSQPHSTKFKTFVKMLWPLQNDGGDEGFYEGNTLGSWDLKARYRLRDGSEVKAYFQWPWEDGSGMGKLNGFDGLWGVEYNFPARSTIVRGAAFEYLDLTNQSGPMHWDPDDQPGTDLGYRAEGADDYYNNAFYNPYASYGHAQGSPMVMSPLYNLDGYMQFVGNRTRAVHVAVIGAAGPRVDWRVKFGYRKAWGNGMVQLPEAIHATSFMLEGTYRLPQVPGLSIGARFALDHGTMPANATAGMVTIRYNGSITL